MLVLGVGNISGVGSFQEWSLFLISIPYHTGCFFLLVRPIFSTKKKNVVQPTRIFCTSRISWNRISDWLPIVFHFGTENWEEQLKKPPCIYLCLSTQIRICICHYHYLSKAQYPDWPGAPNAGHICLSFTSHVEEVSHLKEVPLVSQKNA